MDKPPTIFGLETEYGIFIPIDQENGLGWMTSLAAYDVVQAISELNVSSINRGLEGIQDQQEHHIVEQEAIDTQHDLYDLLRRRPSPGIRQRRALTGFILETGARWYVDLGHPEYSTPEVTNPYDIVLVQKAGDWIAEECRKRAQERMRVRRENPDIVIHIHRNNSDGRGSSYAAHENYALTPDIFTKIIQYASTIVWCPYHRRHERAMHPSKSELTNFVLKFFVTRQIITGSGKVGSEVDEQVPYQISQRADFMCQELGLSTVEHRPIINTRDQPHADENLLRRLHVIVGDSNMSELSIYLKFGITSLFFQMIESGMAEHAPGTLAVPIVNAVRAYRGVSRDLTLMRKIRLTDGSRTTAYETQVEFCEWAKTFVARKNLAPVWHDVINKWEGALQGLGGGDRGKHAIAGNLDWVKKERLLAEYQKKTGDGPLDEGSRSLALAYHDINPEWSIYDLLVRQGRIMRLVGDEEIAHAIHNPPSDTRAWLRGELMHRYPSHLSDIGWNYAYFTDNTLLHMDHPSHGTKKQIVPIVSDDPPLDVFLARLKELIDAHLLPGYVLSSFEHDVRSRNLR